MNARQRRKLVRKWRRLTAMVYVDDLGNSFPMQTDTYAEAKEDERSERDWDRACRQVERWVRATRLCPECRGSRVASIGPELDCRTCRGQGRVSR